MFRLILTCLLFLNPVPAKTQDSFRIITLAPNLTELVYSAGAGEYLVATDNASNYPEAALHLPKVGNLHQLDIEEILQLQPDLLLIWQDGLTPQLAKQLKSLKLKTKLFNGHNLNEIPQIIEEIIKTTPTYTEQHHENRRIGEENAYQLKKIILETSVNYGSSTKQTYFIQIWDNPLVSLSQKQFLSQALEICNLENILQTTNQMAPQANLEEILKQNPDLIILSGAAEKTQIWKKDWQKFSQLNAVKNNKIYELKQPDIYHRPSERFIRAIPQLCQQLNPLKPNANP